MPNEVLVSDGDYQLIDSGQGERLEQWGPYRLRRPDPGILWERQKSEDEWNAVDAEFLQNGKGGEWKTNGDIPERWVIEHGGIKLYARLTPFKHTGVFPEQAVFWNWMQKTAEKKKRPITVLNLFAYTGGASVALAKAGHSVTHVDSAKPAVTWARENLELNDLPPTVRWIHDDALDFVQREVRRGKTYDAILLDPPAYGHGPDGTPWNVQHHLEPLLKDCVELLSADPAFLLVNSYGKNAPSRFLGGLLQSVMSAKTGRVEKTNHGELCIQEEGGRVLSTGIFGRWEK